MTSKSAGKSVEARPVKRPRHLMDPNNLQRPVNDRSLTNVQRWVFSVLVVFTIAHLAVGVAIAAQFVNDDATAARIGLNIIAMVFGILGVAAGIAIHRKPPFDRRHAPWLLLGTIPGIVGLVLALS
ncbi:hypothetical protein [Nocardioides sp. Kera G14]|uniref:hypothetical protein n=1 Tax=Nocardioides sp. Kera G14 TaxID=2884264 RepID=UPI001D12A710|nr:hypothetical protein [Nocardioides sp. Kera G14]UDY23321.1 hypothetical protein LH076_14835 [Nocardioides sp. Kera G14]